MKRPVIAFALFLALAAGWPSAAKADDGQLETVVSWLEGLIQADLSWIWTADQLEPAVNESTVPDPASASPANDPEFGPSLIPDG